MPHITSAALVKAAKPILAILMASPAFLGLPVAASQDGGQGMLLLYSDARTGAVDAAFPRLEDLGCAVWRRGSVGDTQGKLDVGSPDRFVLFACSADVLDSAENRAALEPILAAGEGALAVEGPILFRNADRAAPDALLAREYIFKISHYNNLDPDGREQDLGRLNAVATEKPDAWKTEAVFSVARAVGMATPDIVDVIYYDSAQQGKRFRKQNRDIIKKIGQFNKAHVDQFTYISALLGQ